MQFLRQEPAILTEIPSGNQSHSLGTLVLACSAMLFIYVLMGMV